MPQATPIITVVDGSNITYNPVGIDSNQVASFRDRALGELIKQPVVAISAEEPKAGGRKTTKGLLKLTAPRSVASASVGGAPTIDNDLFKVEMLCGASASVADRESVYERGLALLAHPDIKAAFVNPEHFW